MTPVDKMPGGPFIRSEERLDRSLSSEVLKYCSHPDKLNPWILDVFSDPDFVQALPESMKDPKILAQFLENCSNYADSRRQDIYGENVDVPETEHQDGRIRHAESGQMIDLEKIKALGINPKQILYYRRSQPADKPKPEHYWTSDYWEVRRGLNAEISGEQREKSIILCSTLDDIAQDGGVMADINDDEGVAVRRINTKEYDQKRCLFTFKPTSK